jgi:hypothetical protein
MFMIVRYLNTVHQNLFVKVPVNEAAADLLSRMGVKFSSADTLDLLLLYRKMERDS